MATSTKRTKIKKITKQRKVSWKLVLPIILLAALAGVYYIYSSKASTNARIVNINQFPTLRKGSNNRSVVSLRRYLGRAVGQNYGESQVFDANLDTAVRNIQRLFGLSVDGVVGPRTWTAILNANDIKYSKLLQRPLAAPDVSLGYAYGTYLLKATCPQVGAYLMVTSPGSAWYGSNGGYCSKAGKVLSISAANVSLPTKGSVGEVQWNVAAGQNYSHFSYVYFP